ncbi:phage tail protein [Moraxella catarrhalis]|uniref:C40 family peptidase n=1 Tax=Moraxella catarrhalis TaxID=480 RepID=UPI00128BE8ED|nr:Mov34/MPN/PAD-1 family protein [Moraxella catarrhalis]MCG6814124.1 C40 family peptidase [Moraxella catarrhalis]MPX50614.1 phage tail protein [Moraxella catarrhalis]MPX71644.1 phage tail protein [Moraxella catarrhalis]MPX74154.1 phage tail protein [Moraxella catarrhalis]
MRLTKTIKEAIHAHAKICYPAECCGLIIDGQYYPCDNVAVNPTEHFEIDPKDFARAESMGQIQAIVHSHPDGNAEPSEIDRVQMSIHGLDWVICAFGYHADGKEYFDVKCHKPKAYQAPLLGREYHHGVQDCYSLVRDYYSRELDIHLPDFHRRDGWWEDENHEPLYENNFTKAGFIKMQDETDLQKHDVILCRVGRTHHVNHALIYVGDGKLKSETTPDCVGNALILHHPHGSLSVREIYGDNWQRRTAMVVRHQASNQTNL